MATATVYAICEPCGVLVADGPAHALWHARIADIVPLLAALVTTLDPATGDPVLAVRSVSESAAAAAAETLKGQATTSYTANVAYLAVPAPATPQVVAQVRAVTQQLQALIRLAVRALT